MNKKFENKEEWKASNELVVDIHKLLSGMPIEKYEDPFSLSNEKIGRASCRERV